MYNCLHFPAYNNEMLLDCLYMLYTCIVCTCLHFYSTIFFMEKKYSIERRSLSGSLVGLADPQRVKRDLSCGQYWAIQAVQITSSFGILLSYLAVGVSLICCMVCCILGLFLRWGLNPSAKPCLSCCS